MDKTTIQIYDERASEFSREYSNVDMSEVQKLLLRYLSIDGPVLEIGCGTGREAIFLANNGFSVTATDASSELLKQGVSQNSHTDLIGKLEFFQATFPLLPDDKLFQRKYTSVLAIGVLMHIPEQDLFEAAFQIRKLLHNGGTLFFSVSENRQGLDPDNRGTDGRLFIERPIPELRLLFERLGFRFIAHHKTSDSLKRDIQWHSLVFMLESSIGDKPVDQIEIIINRDRKTATYKLALLRALCEIAQTTYHHINWHFDDTVSLPLWLVAEKWLYYYWPLMENNIPQIRGEGRNKPEAFRKDMLDLIRYYSRRGGFNAFHVDYQNGRFPRDAFVLITAVIKKIAKTITEGPIQYSSQGDFAYFKGKHKRSYSTIDEFVQSLGYIRFRADIWREMSILGHWISEAIILRWAELTHSITQRKFPVSDVIEKLLMVPEADRQIKVAKDLYKSLPDLSCVWTNKPLKAGKFDVDHMIPFALWHNNELWNLVPTDSKINNLKRDKLVARDALFQSQERIIYCWQQQHMAMHERFEREITRTLLGKNRPERQWEKIAFTSLIEAIETIALQRGIERWMPK